MRNARLNIQQRERLAAYCLTGAALCAVLLPLPLVLRAGLPFPLEACPILLGVVGSELAFRTARLTASVGKGCLAAVCGIWLVCGTVLLTAAYLCGFGDWAILPIR